MLEKRSYPRRKVNVRTRLVIIDEPGEKIREQGSALVRNISPKGVLISDLDLPTRSLPITPFKVNLIITEEGPLNRLQMLCSVRRVTNNGQTRLGLNIDKIPEKHQAILREFVRS